MAVNVLFIDSYDSFTYNLVSLIRAQNDDTHVTIVHNDTFPSFNELKPFLTCFDCIVVGPGPGNPDNGYRDVGFLNEMFEAQLEVPVLGICLGFQVMCRAAGGSVKQLTEIKHGQVYEVEVCGANEGTGNRLFANYPPTFNSVRYHSLHVAETDFHCENIIPLCYTNDENGQVLMGAQIANTSWYGVQYHPESCCSELGDRLISNFLEITEEFNRGGTRHHSIYKLQDDDSELRRTIGLLDKAIDKSSVYEKAVLKPKKIHIEELPAATDAKLSIRICNALSDPFFLMSSSTIQENRGEFSIIALPNENSTVFTHYDQLHVTSIHRWRDPIVSRQAYTSAISANGKVYPGLKVIKEDKSEFWKSIGDFMKNHLTSNTSKLPFLGGLVGVLGYEMGQFTVNGNSRDIVPDAKLVFIENCIIVDLRRGVVSFVSLNDNFPHHLKNLVKEIARGNEHGTSMPSTERLPPNIKFDIELPTKEAYTRAYQKSQTYLRQGDSYEICLTTQTKVTPSDRIEPWRVFQTLIQRNPAPFSSFFEFSDLHAEPADLCLLSTSPERFLKWDCDSCELRPIKGTVRKDGSMTLELATKILKTPKEFGENLMILDLIRNDLYELLEKVTVDELMSVEEYKTVYQLVSVVKGHELNRTAYSGIDLLRHSLPPGSMTGAPKKNTVHLLQTEIEKDLNSHLSNQGIRGVYSGVTGYWSIHDHGDWSVNIRCMYSYDNARSWRLGAGGAVTILSTLEGEWEEMHTKLESALQVFRDV
ncbi:LADA_0F14554g1_1 [Lachancea dasiensis]|uniref:aminodeoxychorismate synthase n=1 Tax=Lachancea dasiensis TaxID=1072105 RepID=A0A1G4JN59_9SACH|nr:LADA_0F14554g1_1 [Lachancea dasiensis]